MKASAIADEIDRMAQQPGIVGCAVVDAGTGMVWTASAARRAASAPLWEAAVDYWRLHRRLESHFEPLGALQATLMYHTAGVLAVFPCGTDPELLLVAHGQHRGVDWAGWQAKVRAMGRTLRSAS